MMRLLLSKAVTGILLAISGTANAQVSIPGLPGPPPVIDPFNRPPSPPIIQSVPASVRVPVVTLRPTLVQSGPFLSQLPFGPALPAGPTTLSQSITAPTAADLASGLAYGTPGARGLSQIVARPPVTGYAYVPLYIANRNVTALRH